ncbi:MAG: efflux RND transporter periplasmic adaptor subunit [Candidatus Woesebacteria bacterium]|nr:efflux RND transporter periplasmic adaptor subunit [Candidatus Woesebacteria bacterium]
MAKKEITLNLWQKVVQKAKSFWGWLRFDRKRLIGAGLILLVLIFGIWKITSAKSSKVQYQTSTVQKGTIVSTISASGKVLTTNTLAINAQTSGVVKKVYIKDGDRVTAGQKLAEIELDSDGTLANARAYASLISAQNGVNSANNGYRSTQASLANVYDQLKGHSTDETFAQKETRTRAEVSNDNAFDQLRSAQANLVSSSYSYRLTSPIITAPFSGVVGSVGLVEGMVMSSSTSTTSVNSQRVAVIKGDSLPVISVSLSEVDVPNIKVGQKVTVTLDSIPDKTFTGVVATVDRVGSTTNNVTSYNANIKLDSESDAILPNMAATANIILQTKTDVLMVPSTVLITQNGTTYAKTLVNGSEVDVAVETGISSDTDTEIVTGLSEGQTVITGTTSTATASTTTRSVFSGGFGTGGNVRAVTGGR